MAREPQRSTDILDAVALLVVDMQDVFINMVPDGPAVAERCGFAIEAARLFGLKVIFTEQVPQKLGPTHAPLAALAPNARVFAKTAFSALQAEGLQEYLRRLGVYHLLLAGVETPVCVYQTALHAHDSDFDVTVLADCTGGRRSDDCRVALEAVARSACHVLPAEGVFYSMLGTSAHPRFSEFTRLVKHYSQPGALSQVSPVAAPLPEPVKTAPTEEPVSPPKVEAAPAQVEPDGASRDEPPPEDDERPPARESMDGDDEGARGDGDDEPGREEEREDKGEVEGGKPGDRPRRGRRRRGGARRRRARERAAQGGDAPGGAEAPAAGLAPSSSEPTLDAPLAPLAPPRETAPAGEPGPESPPN